MRHLMAILLFSIGLLTAANAQQLLTAQAQGMGGQSVFLQGESALFGNPAGLATMENWAAMAAFERRFLLADLDLLGAAAALPTRSGSFGLLVQRFGFEEFVQQKFALGYGRKLARHLLLGGQVDFWQTQIDEYGSTGTLSFELGLQARISEELVLGTHLINPAPVELAEGEDLPTIVRAGAAYQPSKNVTAAFELEKDVDFPLRVKAGVEYRAAPILQLRAGFSSNPGVFHFGLGLHLPKGLRVDTAMRYHQTLGMTPTVGLGYSPAD